MAAEPTESSYRIILQILAQAAPVVKKQVSPAFESPIPKSNDNTGEPVASAPEAQPDSPDSFRRRPG